MLGTIGTRWKRYDAGAMILLWRNGKKEEDDVSLTLAEIPVRNEKCVMQA